MMKDDFTDKKSISLLWLLIPVVGIFIIAEILFALNVFSGDKLKYWMTQEYFFLHANAFFNFLPSRFWSNITHLGDAAILIPILSIFIIKKPKVWFAIIVTSVIAGTFSLIGKNAFQVPRPAAVLDPQNFVVIGELLTKHNSLPSGHTITIFAAVFTFLVLLCRFSKTRYTWLWLGMGFSFATMVGLSRLAVGAHWPIDILLGAMLGWVAGVGGAFFYLRIFEHTQPNVKSYVSFIISFALLCLSLIILSRGISDPFNGPIYIVSALCGMTSSASILLNHLKDTGKIRFNAFYQPTLGKQLLRNTTGVSR
jgi:membrane-associated phospholipid phosphatase|tara:strand:+ start:483 stop:1412 length:930 start_codon:yes stop_codon:yes gene_type:complete